MKKLTKKRALEICRDLWDWLADHPEADKEHWPGWEKVGEMEADCPCCEYAGNMPFLDTRCEHCPLLDYWPRDEGLDNPCTSSRSPYEQWYGARLVARRPMFARRIANYARKALKSLEE